MKQEKLDIANNPKEYWLKILSNKCEKISLGKVDKNTSGDIKYRKYSLDKDILDRLNKLSRKDDLMIYIILMSSFQITVNKYSGELEFLMGTPQYLKSKEMINNNEFIVIPTCLNNEETFKTFLIENKKELFEAYNNQTYPVVDLLKRKSRYADVNLYFAMKNIHSEKQINNILRQENNDLTFIVERNSEEINIICNYFNDEIEKEVNIIINLFINIVKEVMNNLDVRIKDIEAIDKKEKDKLILEFNDFYKSYPKDKTIHALFEDQVKKTPNNVAVMFEDKQITYKELNERSNALAKTLIKEGVVPDSKVAIILEPCIEMVIGNLAILKSGGAYVPIDPAYPLDRIRYILEDCGIDILLANKNWGEDFEFAGKILNVENEEIYSDDCENIGEVSSVENLAYVIYTSGTSGKPKGVMVEHGAITTTLRWRKDEYNISESDTVLPIVANSFDGFITSFYTPIISGAKVRLLSSIEKSDVIKIKQRIIEDKTTHLVAVPSLCSAIMDILDSKDKVNINAVTVAGEMLTSKVVSKCKNINSKMEIFNEYGPTENSVISTLERGVDESGNITIGKPISNTRIYILDKLNNIVPIGVSGELCISGDGLARGYINNDILTSQKFIENPYEAGSKMYKTGDLARWLPDGNIEFLGRIDHQVKIRGFRIELGEVEKNLLMLEDVKECTVIDKGEEGNKYLCAYYISDNELEIGLIKKKLSEFIPGYMIPSYFTRVKKMPLTSNGKVDRKALLSIEDNFNISAIYEPARNELEEKLIKIWTEILEIDRIGINDNFFELGGHSLKATLLVGRIHKEFNVEVPLKNLFELGTIKGLSNYMNTIDKKEFIAIERVEENEYYDVSSAQKRMYMLQEFDKDTIAYNMPGAIEINGELDINKIENSFKKLIEKHETLRTSFETVGNNIVQKILNIENIELEVEEISVDCEDNIDNKIRGFIRPFNLSKAPLLRVGVMRINENRSILLFDMHHIISDGMSMSILTSEFIKGYAGQPLDGLSIQYKDYSAWQSKRKDSDNLKKQENYWITEFSGEIPVLNLPTDYVRGKEKSFEGSSESFTVDSNITKKLKQIAKETGTTMYMLLLSNLNILLSKYSGQDDIVVGSPIAGRNHRDLENIIGMFINTLAIRSEVNSKSSFKEYLKVIKEKTLNAYENQDYQFDDLVDKVQVTRDLSRNSLFDVMFIFQNMNSIEFKIEGLNAKPYILNSTVEPFDITMTAIEENNEIAFKINYATSLYKKESIKKMGRHYLNIIKSITENIEVAINDIELLDDEEKKKILIDFNDTYKEYSIDKTIHEMFEEQVKRTPNNIAVSFEDIEITYKDLNEKANMLARSLIEKGVRKESIVSIIVNRSIDMMIGILAILKAGAAYLPIDPEYPEDRINYILEDSGTKVVITEPDFKEGISSNYTLIDIKDENSFHKEYGNLGIRLKGHNLAYVIYTSGTTGNPKGVMIEHRQIHNFIQGMKDKIELKDCSSILCVTTVSFDIFGLETLLPLTKGMRISITPSGEDVNGDKISEIIEKNNVEIMQSTPSRIRLLMENSAFRTSLNKLKTILVGGESIPGSLLEELNKYKKLKIYNMYGPTETTIWSAVKDLTGENKITIGKPINNTRIYILDKLNNIVPIGVPGEICIAGDGLSRGYINNEVLTKEKFIQVPYEKDSKVYRTGDLGRWNSDGNIEFIGRIDYQVKIRGFRIELEEIENCLAKLPNIEECIVIDKGSDENKYLCAYYVSEKEFEVGELRKELKKSLPDYMIPSYFIKLEKIPSTPNGKVDRKELRNLKDTIVMTRVYEGPRNILEEKLIKIWQDVLGIDQIGITDNFFEIGGQSLKATLLVGRIYNELNIDIPLKEIFKLGDIKGLSEYMESMEEKEFRTIEKVEEKEFYEASSTQKRMYMLQEFDKESIAHNITGAMEVSGKLHVQKVKEAFNKIIEKHETLRTSFETKEDNIVQIVHDMSDINFEIEQIHVNSEGDINNRLSDFVKPFDLSKAPLLKIGLVELNEERNILIFDMHHIISDGTSMSILANEFVKGYEGLPLGDLKVQYKDYTQWQLNKMQGEEIKRQERYWLDEFSGEIPVLNLPTDYARGSQIDFKGNNIKFELNKNTTEKLKALAKDTGSTMYMVLLANINLLLSKYSGQEDIIIGSLIAGRNHRDIENVIGMFVNTLAIRSRVTSELSFKQYLNIIKEKTLNAYENQDYQFEELLEKVTVSRDLSRNQLFDVMFILQNMDEGKLEVEDLKFKPYNFNNNSEHFDMTIYAEEVNDGVAFKLSYATRLFKEETITTMINRFLNMVDKVVDNVELKIKEIEILSEAEKNNLLVGFNNNDREYPKDKTIQQMFEEQVEKTPNNIAISFEDKEMSYRELNERSNALARTLRNKGVKAGTIIGIMVDRSLEMVIGVLAIIKSGAAYVPIDPNYPTNRINYMLQNSNASILITEKSLIEEKDFECEIMDIRDGNIYSNNTSNLEIINEMEDLLYVLYTSGTTGNPKGVMIEQRNLVNMAYSWRESYDLDNMQVKLLQIASIAFDVFVGDICRSLLTGGTMYICPTDVRLNMKELGYLINDKKINILESTPSLIMTFIEYINENNMGIDSLRLLILGSDSCKIEDYKELVRQYGSKMRIINSYGITEATIDSSYYEEKFENISGNLVNTPIGRPMHNIKFYILNDELKIQPIGVIGELYIGGAGVARGYNNNEELTKLKFVDNPFEQGQLMYKTGDLAKWLDDGNVEFLGRKDHQVKIRGFRIEIGEIENTLLKIEGIKDVVVIDVDIEQNKYLCAYYVGVEEVELTQLREKMKDILPDYMIPSYFIRLEKLPLTPNGKIDRKTLPSPKGMINETINYEAPRNDLEETLVKIWSSVLNVEKVGINDNFFELGGHSLKATLLVGRIYKILHVEIPLKEIFRLGNIKNLSEYIKFVEADEFRNIEKVDEKQYYEASSAQKRMYMMQILDKNSTACNMAESIEIEGELQFSKVENAFEKLIEKHETLRTSFETKGDSIIQRIHEAKDISFNIEEILINDESEIESKIENFTKPFDLSLAPLLRVGVIKVNESRNILLFDMHHIVSDGVSMSILTEEFAKAYEGKALGRLNIQYKDYSAWQEKKRQSNVFKKQEEYWIKEFSGCIPRLNLPVDYERENYQSFEGDSIIWALDKDKTKKLKSITRETQTTMHMFLLASLNVVLSKYVGQEDIIVGTPIAGRNHPDLENIIGMFVNTLAIRSRVDNKLTFKEYLKVVKEKTLSAYENQDYQFDDLVEKLDSRQDLNRNPLFDVMLVLQNMDRADLNIEGLKLKSCSSNKTEEQFDITVIAIEGEEELHFKFNYASRLFKKETIESLIEYFKFVLELLLEDIETEIGNINLLTESDLNLLLDRSNENEIYMEEFQF